MYSKGKLELVEQLYDPSYRGHDTLDGDFGRDDLKRNVQMYRSAFPDLNLKVDDLVSAGDKVLIRWTGRGTHRGPFMGQQPTGRQTTTQGMTVATLRNGKIIEDWTQWDALGLLQALGMAPQLDQGAQAAP
jgi:steroid delta-isomerase-like uncharacterized protein